MYNPRYANDTAGELKEAEHGRSLGDQVYLKGVFSLHGHDCGERMRIARKAKPDDVNLLGSWKEAPKPLPSRTVVVIETQPPSRIKLHY